MTTYLKDVTTLRLDARLCTGCGRCLEVCPRGVFRRAGAVVEIREPDRCLECGACMRNCAFDAVSVRAGVGCAVALLATLFDPGREPVCGCDSGGDCCG